MAPFPPFPMHEMTKTEWVLNNPEWVSVLAASLFGFVTIYIIATQAVLSHRAQRRQNDLLQYQLEYARMQSLNIVREKVLALLSRFRTPLGLVKQGIGDGPWYDLLDAFYDLYDKVQTLDASIFSGYYDGWYANLDCFMDDMFAAVANDSKTDGRNGTCPTATTVRAFKEAESKWDPTNITIEIKTAIRMTGNEFYENWKHLMPVV